jgi:hypothetical protein
MNTLRSLWVALLVTGFTFAACGGNGAGEGEDDLSVPDTVVVEDESDLEEGVEATGEAVEQTGEAIGEGVEEIGDKAEDAADAVD